MENIQVKASRLAAEFHRFLPALYNLPYKLRMIHELSLLTQLADYYCVLPAVSRTISGAIQENIFRWFPVEVENLIDIAPLQ
jgi:hypothetical protein